MRDFGTPIPARVAALPMTSRGFPIPFFVERVPGAADLDFRVMSAENMIRAVRRELCWVCGQKLGRFRAFVGGPLAAGQRLSAEPPSHSECAEFAARACPYLANPSGRHRATDMPEHGPLAGVHAEAHPEVVAVLIGRAHEVLQSGGAPMFRMAEPVEVRWFRVGRPASRADVLAALPAARDSFLSLSRKPGAEAEGEFARIEAAVLASLPAA
jgi:hypothetical protein